MEAAATVAGVPLYRVTAGNLRADALNPSRHFASLPLHVRRPDGKRGMIHRQCTYDFFAKCPHRLACARYPCYLPKQSHAGQLLAVKDGIQQMLEQLELTDDERDALEGDRDAVAALANRLADVPTPVGPTPNELGAEPSSP